ncbi:MAG: hypothetical protein K6U87_17235, partial [Firmicutes bacterium]|nr:hypothetical protein [Bacillota bacterium]
MGEVYDTVSHAVERLIRITEAKIQATVERNPNRLLALLQEELDHLHTLDQWQDACLTLSPEEKARLKKRVEFWQERGRFLQELLQQQLGYLDFIRSLLGAPVSHGLDIGL